jgi:hypothetical protein
MADAERRRLVRTADEVHGRRRDTAERSRPKAWLATEWEPAGRPLDGPALRREKPTADILSGARHEERPLQVSRRTQHGPEDAGRVGAQPPRALEIRPIRRKQRPFCGRAVDSGASCWPCSGERSRLSGQGRWALDPYLFIGSSMHLTTCPGSGDPLRTQETGRPGRSVLPPSEFPWCLIATWTAYSDETVRGSGRYLHFCNREWQ